MFHVIQDAVCITRNKNGIYKQAKLYRYKDGLYVGTGGGFARLLKDGDVCTPNLSFVELYLPSGYRTGHDSTMRMTVTKDEE